MPNLTISASLMIGCIIGKFLATIKEIYILSLFNMKLSPFNLFLKNYHPIPWRDSTSRPIAPQAVTIPVDHASAQFYKRRLGTNFEPRRILDYV
jgi:hypothetical protein